MVAHPKFVADREKVRAIRELFVELGGDLDHPEVLPKGIWAAVQKANPKHHNSRWPNYLKREYDPHVDEVAVMRALEGDVKVLDALTHYEHLEFLDRLGRLSEFWEDWSRANRVGTWPNQKLDVNDRHEGVLRFGEERWTAFRKLLAARTLRLKAAPIAA